ncbi:MMPL family transporter [Microbacterium sp. NPDC055312]
MTTRAQLRTQQQQKKKLRSVWRVLISAALILLWLTGAGLGGPLFGKIDEVSSNDRTTYLPDSADATEVQRALDDFLGSDSIPAVVVFSSDAEIDDALKGELTSALEDATTAEGVKDGSSPVIVSDDALAAQAFVPIDADADIGEISSALSADLRESVPDGVDVYITGPAGFTADLVAGFAGIDGILLLVALAAVLVILVIVYRSLLLPVVVLSTSLFALCVALLVVWWAAKFGILLLSGQTQGILFILVIGAATDYSLLMVARFREELHVTENRWAAVAAAWRGSFEPILASGGTVIAGLLCLLLSDLKSNSTLGPVAAIGIVFAMLAALTLLPALLGLFGRAAFWPRRPTYEPERVADVSPLEGGGLWPRLARGIRTRPRLIWISTAIVLAIAAVGVVQLDATGVPQSDLVLGASEARDGQEVLGEHFPGGSGSPAYVLGDEDRLQDAADVLLSDDGVDGVSVTAEDSPSGSAPVTADGITAFGPPGTPAPEPTVIDGRVLLQGTLTDAADSADAEATVDRLRAELDETGAKIGGVTATAVDTNTASIHDRNLIIPVILGVILVILMLLLRAVLAPVLLILTTVLSFGSAMGVAALLFNGVFRFPGADPAVPLFGFVFLVALGIDYNIFLMTRVREESKRHGTREGILRGLAVTGGVITSAGLVLAATFAALSVIPILFLVQLAFIVAFGVLLDTFVVRSLLVPALGYDIGRAIWWPSKLSRRDAEPTGDRDEQVVSAASTEEHGRG